MLKPLSIYHTNCEKLNSITHETNKWYQYIILYKHIKLTNKLINHITISYFAH